MKRTCTRIGVHRIRGWIAACTVVALLVACGNPGAEPPTEGDQSPVAESLGVRVAAASDLQFAMAVLIEEFARQQPNVAVTPTFGSSGNFHTQIKNGAPFDLFFSADVDFPAMLVREGFADEGSLFEYGVGRIVVAAAGDSPLDVKALGTEALTDPSVRKIAIANPQHAPYGRAAEAALKSLGLYDQVEDKLVLGENISQAAQFLDSGAAEVGIIALSLALAPTATYKFSEIPAGSHPEILQGGAIVANAQDKPAARLFRDFVQSEKGLQIMADFGFAPPES